MVYILLSNNIITGYNCYIYQCIVISESAALFIQGDRSLSMLIGEIVVDSKFFLVPVSTFEKEGSVVGLFFSGLWSPPSRYMSL